MSISPLILCWRVLIITAVVEVVILQILLLIILLLLVVVVIVVVVIVIAVAVVLNVVRGGPSFVCRFDQFGSRNHLENVQFRGLKVEKTSKYK